MNIRKKLMTGAALALSLSASAAPDETVLCDGTNPAVSPDGRGVAFSHYEDGVMKLGVYDFATKQVRWIENGPGMAAYPAWTPKGDLIYTFGNDTETAYESFKKNDSSNGYHLRRFTKDGMKVDLTSGRVRDYTPIVSPDGQKVYFTTTRWVKLYHKYFSVSSTSMIGELTLTTGNMKMIVDTPNGQNSGVVCPAISPNGKVLLWSHLNNFFEYWRIYGAKLSDCSPNGMAPFTPEGMIATAPRWHPSGDMFCFQGFVLGDPAFGVWVMNVKNGFVKRLCSGENPTFTPDGKSIVFDRDRKLVMRPFTNEDEPTERKELVEDVTKQPEQVLGSWTGNWTKATTLPLDPTNFVFGVERPIFVRAKVKLNGSEGFRVFVKGVYEESDLAIQLYMSEHGELWFSTRDYNKSFVGVMRKGNLKGEHTITGIRIGRKLYVALDNEKPRRIELRSRMSLDHPKSLIIGSGMKSGEAVTSVEIGTGWPKNVNNEYSFKEVMK